VVGDGGGGGPADGVVGSEGSGGVVGGHWAVVGGCDMARHWCWGSLLWLSGCSY
jgi:hypothetical protein